MPQYVTSVTATENPTLTSQVIQVDSNCIGGLSSVHHTATVPIGVEQMR